MIKMDHSRNIIWVLLVFSSWIPFSYWHHETTSRNLSPAEDSDSNGEVGAQGRDSPHLSFQTCSWFFPLSSGMKLFSLELLLGTECKFQSFVSRTVRLEAVPQMCCGALLAHQGSREHHPACATEWLFSMCSRILHRELNFQVSER